MADDYVLRRSGGTGPFTTRKIAGGIETDGGTPDAHAASHGAEGADPIEIAQSQVTGLVDDLADNAQAIITEQEAREAADGTLNTYIGNVQLALHAETVARTEADNTEAAARVAADNALAATIAGIEVPTAASKLQALAGTDFTHFITPQMLRQATPHVERYSVIGPVAVLGNATYWLAVNSGPARTLRAVRYAVAGADPGGLLPDLVLTLKRMSRSALGEPWGGAYDSPDEEIEFYNGIAQGWQSVDMNFSWVEGTMLRLTTQVMAPGSGTFVNVYGLELELEWTYDA